MSASWSSEEDAPHHQLLLYHQSQRRAACEAIIADEETQNLQGTVSCLEFILHNFTGMTVILFVRCEKEGERSTLSHVMLKRSGPNGEWTVIKISHILFVGYCPTVWDGVLCWSKTLLNTTSVLPCPD